MFLQSIYINVHSLFPKGNATFMKLPFFGGGSAGQWTNRPNVMSTKLLVTIFCLLLPGAFFLMDMTQGHWTCRGSQEKIGKPFTVKVPRPITFTSTLIVLSSWYNSSKIMEILHSFQAANSHSCLPPCGQLANYWVITLHVYLYGNLTCLWLRKNWTKDRGWGGVSRGLSLVY